LEHSHFPQHPESCERLEAIVEKLETLGLMDDYLVPEPASDEEVTRVHSPSYLEFLRGLGEGYLDFDTAFHRKTLEIAYLAAGGAITAARDCLETGTPHFALIRPPGHHAGPDYGGGFCYLNNAALATEAVLESVDRAAIIDIDGHHGNGTSDLFCQREDVLYVSFHQWGIFPGTGPPEYVGEGAGEGHVLNFAFPALAGDSSYLGAFQRVVEPVLKAFRPSVLLVSCGVDAHYKDPLTSLTLTSAGYVEVARRILEAAKVLCGGRAVFLLEGGYHHQALAEVVAGIVASFGGDSLHLQYESVQDRRERGRSVTERVAQAHSRYWPLSPSSP
jgi:acetoin utilization deacetylase AcuC-like enzyme